mgnify:CR=1 FL=1
MPTAWALHSGAFDLREVAGVGTEPWVHVVDQDALLQQALRALRGDSGGGNGSGGDSSGGNGTSGGSDGSAGAARAGVADGGGTSGRGASGLSGAGIDWAAAANIPAYSEIDCCNKKPGDDYVDFVPCRWMGPSWIQGPRKHFAS